MLGKPLHGWTDIVVSGELVGTASYVDDVPNNVLDGFISWFSAVKNNCHAGFCLEFDAEWHNFGIIGFDGGLHLIDDLGLTPGDPLNVKELDGEPALLQDRLAALGREAISDIRENIEEWKSWNTECDGDDEAAEGYKSEYLRKCSILEGLIGDVVPRETCIPGKNTCQDTCFTGNKEEAEE